MNLQSIQLKKNIGIGASDPDFFRDTDFAYVPVSGRLNVYGVASVDSVDVRVKIGTTEVVLNSELNVATKVNTNEDDILLGTPIQAGDKFTVIVVNGNAAAADVRIKATISM